jgi:hypothetical protein
MPTAKILVVLAAAAMLVSFPTLTDSTYELQACLLACRNSYEPTFNMGAFKDCVEDCIRKYVHVEDKERDAD